MLLFARGAAALSALILSTSTQMHAVSAQDTAATGLYAVSFMCPIGGRESSNDVPPNPKLKKEAVCVADGDGAELLVKPGGRVTFTAEPDGTPGYVFNGWKGCTAQAVSPYVCSIIVPTAIPPGPVAAKLIQVEDIAKVAPAPAKTNTPPSDSNHGGSRS
jgi:hypothetical protein